MADSYSVQAVLSVKDKNFTSTLKNATNTLSSLDSSSQKSSTSVGALGTAFAVAEKVVSAACNVIKGSVQEAVARVDTLNQYPKIMEQMGFTSEEAEASIEKLSEGIQGLPTSLDSIVESAQNIALISGNLDEATDVALALNDALLASGASTDEAARATEAYDKMLSTGKVTSQQWTTLEQNMKYALVEVAKQLGITSGSTQELYTAMQNGEISFDQFNAALIECDTELGGFSEMALTACDGIATSWENVKTAVVRGVANMIQAWNEAAEDNGIPTIQESLQGLRNVCDTVFNGASKAITVFVNNLDTIVAAAAPVVTAIAGFKIVQTVSKYFDKFKDSAKKSVDVLQNWDENAKKAKTASDNLKTAQDNLKTAVSKSEDALGKYVTAQGKANDAADKAKAAEEKYNDALEKSKSGIDDVATSTEELNKLEEEAKTATKEAGDAAEDASKAYDEYKASKEDVAAANEAVADASDAEAASIEGTSLKAIAHSAIMNTLTGAMKPAEAAMKAFNAACDANPIGLITTAITTVISVVGALTSKLKDLGVMQESISDKWGDMKSDLKDFKKSLDNTNDSLQRNAEKTQTDVDRISELNTEIINLANQTNRTQQETDQLNSDIDELNGLVPGLGAAFDDLTGSLNMSEAAMTAFTEASGALQILSNTTDELAQKEEELAEIEDELAEYQAVLNESNETLSTTKGRLANGSVKDIIAYNQEKNAVEDLTESQAECEAEIAVLQEKRSQEVMDASQKVAAAYNEEHAALEEMVANDTIAYEDLSEVNQQTVDDMKSSIDDLASSITDGTQSIVTDLNMTADEYLETQQKNQQAIEDWGNNMETLRDRFEALGLDQAILDQWAEVPDQGIPLAATFVDASDEKLEELAASAPEAVETAATASVQAWGVAADEIPSAIQEYITDPTNDSISEQLRNIDWGEPTEDAMQQLFDSMGSAVEGLSLDELGIEINDGVAEGMQDTSSIESASQDVATDIEEDYRSATQTNSPSEMTKPIGTDLNEGIAEGMKETDSLVSAAQDVANTIQESLTSALESIDFSGAVDSMCSTIVDATESGMQQVSTAVTNAMDQATQALNAGFTQMASATTTNMATINSAVTTGMSTIGSTFSTSMQGVSTTMTTALQGVATTVTSQMNNIKSAFTTTLNNIKSTVTSDMNNIKSTITTAMNNIKSTLTSDLNNIKSTVTTTINNIKSSTSSGMNSIKSTFSSGMSSIKSTASSTCSSIVSTFNSLYSSLYSAGASAMSGLQAGLNSRSGSVIATAQSIANSVKNTINSALQVGSPSKVMKKTGKFVGEGLVIGIKDMISDVKAISSKMADAVTDMVFGSFDSPALAFDGGATMSYYFDDAVVDALDDLTDALMDDDRVYEFTVPVEIDGREVAKATATFTQDELNKLQARDSRRQQFSISQ